MYKVIMKFFGFIFMQFKYYNLGFNISWELIKHGCGYLVVYECDYCGGIYYETVPRIINDGVPQCQSCCDEEVNYSQQYYHQLKEYREEQQCIKDIKEKNNV